MPAKYIHAPWLAPAEILAASNVEIGGNYPEPVMDIKESRERALAAFALTKNQNERRYYGQPINRLAMACGVSLSPSPMIVVNSSIPSILIIE